MSLRRVVLILAALLITAGTAIVARNWVAGQQAAVIEKEVVVSKVREPKGPKVLVAQTDIPTGSFVQEGHLRWLAWPEENIPESYMTQELYELEDMIGAVVRRGLSAGEPVTAKRIIRPGDRGFLAAVLRPGYRAMTIQINATTGIGGLVFPGDRVDIILTHTLKAEGEGGKSRKASETILTNVRILAIDQYINESDGKARVAKTATLEITPKQAEMVAVVNEVGHLALSLRSLAKDENELERIAAGEDPLAEPDPEFGGTFTFDSEVSRLVGGTSKTVNVSRGEKSEELSF
ncbi:MAG: Flp pilus assembly protein CpaB [Pseudomonadota bacterium]